MHLGQNRGKFIRTVSLRILVLVLLPQKGHKIQSTSITVKSMFAPHTSLFFNILIDTNIEITYITITKITASNISRAGELITVKSNLLSPTGIWVMGNKVIKKPATGIYKNTLPLIEPSL